MKRILAICLVLAAAGLVAYGAMTNTASKIITPPYSGFKDSDNATYNPIYLFANEAENMLEGTTAFDRVRLTKYGSNTAATSRVIPYICYDDANNAFYGVDANGVTALGVGTWAGGAISADGVLANGKYIESDTTVAHTAGLALRDTTAAAYVPVVLMTNGTTNGTNSVAFGYSSVPMTIASYGGLNVGATGNMTGVGTMAVAGDITMATTKVIKSSVTDTQTVGMSAYDVDGTTYRNVISGTNGNTPAVVLGNAYDSLAIASTGLNVSTAGAVTGVASINFTSGATLYLDVVTVSNAEIKTLYSSPKTLVAAPGTHNVVNVENVVIFYKYGTAAFNTASNNICVYYVNGSGTACTGTISQAGFLDQTTNRTAKLIPVAVAATASASIENAAVVLACATADPTTGGGTATVLISYRILPSGF